MSEVIPPQELWSALDEQEQADACAAFWEARDDETRAQQVFILRHLADLMKFRVEALRKKSSAEKGVYLSRFLYARKIETRIGLVLRSWLLQRHLDMLTTFLDAAGIPHNAALVDDTVVPSKGLLAIGVNAVRAAFPLRIACIYFAYQLGTGNDYWANLPDALHQTGVDLRAGLRNVSGNGKPGKPGRGKRNAAPVAVGENHAMPVNGGKHLPRTLIQLCGSENTGHLAIALKLRPERITHLTTAGTAATSKRLAEVLRAQGLDFELHHVRTSNIPTIEEGRRTVMRAVADARVAGSHPIIHISGVNRLVAIGAYLAAREAGVPSVYFDPAETRLFDQHTGEGIEELMGDLDLGGIVDRMMLDDLAASVGCPSVSTGRDWRPFLALANHLAHHKEDEQACWDLLHGTRGICPHAAEPREPNAWLHLLDVPVALPPRVGELGVEAGLVQAAGDGFTLHCGERELLQELASNPRYFIEPDYNRILNTVKFGLSFLTGGWLEVIVAEAVASEPRFRDVRWSARTLASAGDDELEEDVLAVEAFRVCLFSCKRSGPKGRFIPLMEEMNGRAIRVGGRAARKFLCLARPPHRSICKRAAELGIVVLDLPHLSEQLAENHVRESSPDYMGIPSETV